MTNKKFSILLRKTNKENYASLYQFKTTVIDGETYIFGFDTLNEVDAWVENALNNEGMSKDDFVVVRIIDYTVSADITQ